MSNDGRKAGATDHYWRIPKWFSDLTPEQIDALKIYKDEIHYFNGHMSLISPRTEREADKVHIADAILGSRAILADTKSKEIYDAGSGNGLPGLVMAILAPDRTIKLIDTDTRKMEFLRHSASRIKLSNVSFIQARVEEVPESSISCMVTRGLASLSKCLLMFRRASKTGCTVYHFKGPAWSSEIAEVPPQVLSAWEISHFKDYLLPESATELSLLKTIRK